MSEEKSQHSEFFFETFDAARGDNRNFDGYLVRLCICSLDYSSIRYTFVLASGTRPATNLILGD